MSVSILSRVFDGGSYFSNCFFGEFRVSKLALGIIRDSVISVLWPSLRFVYRDDDSSLARVPGGFPYDERKPLKLVSAEVADPGECQLLAQYSDAVFVVHTDALDRTPIVSSNYVFQLTSCAAGFCPLGTQGPSSGRGRYVAKAVSIINSKINITVVSYGAGGLLQDYLVLSQVEQLSGKTIRYIIIDPIYSEKDGMMFLKTFAILCKNLTKKSSGNVVIEIHAYKNLADYERACKAEKEKRADLILDCDTSLLDDIKITGLGSDYNVLCKILGQDGEFLSLNTNGRCFILGYCSDRSFNFRFYGGPRMFHLKKESGRMELLSLMELDPKTNKFV